MANMTASALYPGGRSRALLLLLLCLLLPSLPAWATDKLPGVVRIFKVFDGEHFIGRTRSRSIRMRLDGVQAPALSHPEGLAAKQVLEKMISGRRVGIVVTGPSDDQPLPVRVTYLNKDINVEMIRSGYAWVWPRGALSSTDLMSAEAQAREAGRGVWADPAVVSPWLRLRD